MEDNKKKEYERCVAEVRNILNNQSVPMVNRRVMIGDKCFMLNAKGLLVKVKHGR